MHLADGILSAPACIVAGGVALASVALTARDLDQEDAPKLGVIAAALFSASLVHVPLAGTSMHFGLYGLAGILLGRRAFPVIFVALLLQALLLGHGGVLSLGINTLNMGFGALVAAGIWQVRLLPESVRAFFGGFLGCLLPAVALVAEFLAAGYGRSLLLLVGACALIAMVEGCLTVLVVGFLRRVGAQLLEPAR